MNDESSLDTLLKAMTQISSLRAQMEELSALVKDGKREGRDKELIRHSIGGFAIMGSDGTGKKMAAQLISRQLAGLGIVPAEAFHAVPASQLLCSEADEIALPKIASAFEAAAGGILMVTQFDTVCERPQAVSKLVEHLLCAAKSANVGTPLLAVASSAEAMNRLLDAEPALEKHCVRRVECPDWDADVAYDALQNFCAASNCAMDKTVQTRVKAKLKRWSAKQQWRHAATVNELFGFFKEKYTDRTQMDRYWKSMRIYQNP